jgi:hypothetical protein
MGFIRPRAKAETSDTPKDFGAARRHRNHAPRRITRIEKFEARARGDGKNAVVR